VSTDLDALYRDVILDHNRHPRHYRAIAGGQKGDGHNPLCGDRLMVYVRLQGGIIAEASFEGFGCAIAKASASLMTESVVGKTVGEAEALFERVRGTIEAPASAPVDDLGPLSALAGVRKFPARAKCATLPWQALSQPSGPTIGASPPSNPAHAAHRGGWNAETAETAEKKCTKNFSAGSARSAFKRSVVATVDRSVSTE
jgi:nitrogen fixation protein NifU and related proteins